MTATLTTSKGPFDMIGLSAPAKTVRKTRDEYGKEVFIARDYNGNIIAEILAEGRELIGWHSQITEDQAREVVDKPFSESFKDYERPACGYKSAIESLRSLMQAERLYTEAKKKPNVMDYDSYGDKHNATFRKHLSEWQEAQSRTFPDWIILKV